LPRARARARGMASVRSVRRLARAPADLSNEPAELETPGFEQDQDVAGDRARTDMIDGSGAGQPGFQMNRECGFSAKALDTETSTTGTVNEERNDRGTSSLRLREPGAVTAPGRPSAFRSGDRAARSTGRSPLHRRGCRTPPCRR